MTTKQQISALVSRIAKKEGKLHQAAYGDVAEIVGIFCDEVCNDPELLLAVIQNGQRRKVSADIRAQKSKEFLTKRKGKK